MRLKTSLLLLFENVNKKRGDFKKFEQRRHRQNIYQNSLYYGAEILPGRAMTILFSFFAPSSTDTFILR